jgi:hypothetical protein
MIAQKALEKTGEKVGEAVAQRSARLFAVLKVKSPQTASAIESALEQPLDYQKTMVEVEALTATDPEFARAIQELEAVSSANLSSLMRLIEGISVGLSQELMTQDSVQLTAQDLEQHQNDESLTQTMTDDATSTDSTVSEDLPGHFWDKADRTAVIIAGGAALGGAIAQLPGAIIGGTLAAVYGWYISFSPTESVRKS